MTEADRAATSWGDLYGAHAARLTRMATTLVGPNDAADLVSETVQRVVLSVSFSEVREPAGYLMRALINSVAARHRATQRRVRREWRVAGRDRVEPFDPTDVVDVVGAIGVLSAQQRAIVFLKYWEDLSIPQIAQWLDVGEGTIRNQLARAKRSLRRTLQ
jgi:RNA polymerase sigma factor (sigma-70 family)